MDDDLLKEMTLRAWKTREGALVNSMMYIGHNIGVFQALPVGESFGAADVAEATGFDERWLQEWLRCMGAAGFVDTDDGEGFVFREEAAAVLADDRHPMFAGGAMHPPMQPAHVEAVTNAMQTGQGFSYGERGAELAKLVEAGFAPAERAMLLTMVVPAIPGLSDRLDAGVSLVDVGCGTGHTLSLLADAFPASSFAGYDPSEPATTIARDRFASNDRVTIHTAFGHDLPSEPGFDVAFTFDCLHDMPRPDRTLAAVRGALRHDGVLVVKEIRSTGDFAKDRKNPVHAMMYGSSLSACLASGTSTPDGLGYGTLGLHPAALEELCAAAGFGSVALHDIGDPVNLYYEVRP